jgi:hypothetical protein
MPWRCIGCSCGNLKVHLRSITSFVDIFEKVFNHVCFVAPLYINMCIVFF